jgi:enamine deaminase RidA (YjgF/YER057c/UK114 family)
MEKTAILPGMWGAIDSDEIDEEQMSYGVVTHRPGYRKVVFSGSVHPEGDVAEQTRAILQHKGEALDDLGGSYDDVTVMRLFVREEELDRETQTRIHEVRAEFFESPHYPAATMVGVAELLHEDALVEIELEAEIPDDGWETEVVSGEE